MFIVSMQIVDLDYLENVSEQEFILGSAGATVISDASATGTSAETFALVKTIARSFPYGGSIAFGRGFAVANDDNPTANVTVAGDGDIVIGQTQSKSFENTAFARGFVIAIDLPRL
ncbi:MAG: hypothetical protein KME60_02440 [Cyanomargarita calcarea GSE-NOS-MK-12-04C]|jgi:pyruvate/2-oxoacid:ferredoxin oxidoreductase beta subunit|uniref:Uncharacterized protein n=1 Tax=Cyanomargarita calcarea GSE-NOS-MK-12-04C TaxID=2839659 RepID=A0A951QJ50_9CYAN|nr:hypothetical protein [Cyanomargarita calcarea GSE-NOS-MK-12-04C]